MLVLAKLYIKAYEITKDDFFKKIAVDILDNLKIEETTSLNSMVVDALLFGSRLDSRYQTKAISILDNILESRLLKIENFFISDDY